MGGYIDNKGIIERWDINEKWFNDSMNELAVV